MSTALFENVDAGIFGAKTPTGKAGLLLAQDDTDMSQSDCCCVRLSAAQVSAYMFLFLVAAILIALYFFILQNNLKSAKLARNS
jgi:hypothetical protein